MNILYTIEKLLKHKYLKWSCILNLSYELKAMMEKKVGCQISKSISSLKEGLRTPSPLNHFLLEGTCSPWQLNPLLPKGTWLGLPFCFLPKESPFLLRASSLKKLHKGFFFIHSIHGRGKNLI